MMLISLAGVMSADRVVIGTTRRQTWGNPGFFPEQLEDEKRLTRESATDRIR